MATGISARHVGPQPHLCAAGRSRGVVPAGLLGVLVVLTALMAVFAQAATAAPFRAFSANSPWNTPAEEKGAITSGNPYASEFTSYSSTMDLEGIPPRTDYAKPTFFASPGDPETPITLTRPDWAPSGDLEWDGRPVPIPAGTAPAPGSDGHLTIISADRRTAWEFWGCTSASAAGIVTQVVAQWDLTGPGYSSRSHNNSARGSGTPLITTTLRADEALGGIDHALGLTIPHSSSDYVRPLASKSDGDGGSGTVKYGMLFVLRDDYPTPSNASVSVRNLIRALKTYGAYIVDQGASMEIDADSTHAELWAQTGLKQKSLPLVPNDWRVVNVGAPSSAKRSTCKRRADGCDQVTLKAARRVVRKGGRVKLTGRIASASAAKHGRKALVQVKRRSHWRTVHTTRIKHNRYSTKVRVHAHAARKVRVRVKVRGLRASKPLVLKIRH